MISHLQNIVTSVYYPEFIRLQKLEQDPFTLVNSFVAIEILADQYREFVRDGITPLESLTKEKKEQYWLIAKRYFDRPDHRMKASKAAYVLELITENVTA